VISGASVKTLEAHDVDRAMGALIEAVNKSTASPVRKAAVAHAFFEQIHPFPDGNGRVGRILLNFVLIAHGLPNVAIKGDEKDRAEYIAALEEADTFVSETLHGKRKWSDVFHHPFTRLEELINRNLVEALDSIICSRFEETRPLLPVPEVARLTNREPDSLAVACSQKKYICMKKSNRLYSHPDLLRVPSSVVRAA
jgi:hypothetical protein